MILFKRASDLNDHLQNKSQKIKIKGFVPTMGALHRGHLSLLKMAKENSDLVIASIFVNPTQFNDPADFKNYPVSIEQDILLLENSGCHILFLPSSEEIYPGGTTNLPVYDLGHLETILEGKYRPGHFQGVCQVMHRLLQITDPDKLFIGQKDYQQCRVIKKLIEMLGMPIETVICPTLRSDKGLALSSRNLLLTDEQKLKALEIYQQLNFIKDNIKTTSVSGLINHSLQQLLNAGFEKIDYVEIASASDLSSVKEYKKDQRLVALIAAYMGKVRLIDNMLLN